MPYIPMSYVFSTHVMIFLCKSIPYFTSADDALSANIAISTASTMSVINYKFPGQIKMCDDERATNYDTYTLCE